ncbi:Uncharacterized conserved protein YbjT, contains NAD(P)-binding and DUF2867 domains [Polaromonas sp. YR568]|uniref:NAD(P)H-binding protein n=1 Tax=Polaromonas sp. YR568 TaxID=1855301 RepID=UPI0008E55007|nr:NAD(P)H-binding protein [Polaromonas sp. YR568]SFU47499.1 Uncharacterized conserved protein YbjT, contains NAD(P)-binding and DUF2867 domains [Polaromonas sp. YR568]
MKVVVMGATGRTGKRVATALLASGIEVHVLGREPARLADLKKAGARVWAGDPTRGDFLKEAFKGADAVYTLLPYKVSEPNYRATQALLGEAIIEGIRGSGVKNVVYLSSLGADQPGGTGMIDTMREQEQRLQALMKSTPGLNVLCLRAGSFFENFYAALDVIKHEGINADAVRPDYPVPMIASSDIADAAVAALKALDWKGFAVRELLGQRDISYTEATRILGERIGRPELQYVQLSYDDLEQTLLAGGFAADVAPLYVDIARAINEDRIKTLEGRNAGNTTATRFEDFAEELARAYGEA